MAHPQPNPGPTVPEHMTFPKKEKCSKCPNPIWRQHDCVVTKNPICDECKLAQIERGLR